MWHFTRRITPGLRRLDKFSKKVWRKGRARKAARYDLAMLINPEETLPPSNRGALKKFIKIGRELGIEVELISQQHYARLPEFDGLFIRETTGILPLCKKSRG
jgi:glutathione synthase/RimK-type ligase-like ATP-grasp enzyme